MSDRAKILVFCERIDNESFCESVVRELEAHYDVRAFGPGWAKEDVTELDLEGARFYLELDSASGNFYRPRELERIRGPRFAWFIDTHKKPDFHREVARDMDLTFHAMKNWGHVLGERSVWLPLHCDTRIFHPVEREREIDLVFVGSYGWRADPLLRIARKHGLKVHVECTTGEREKTKTAELYARSKLVFNRHVSNDLNFRVFEAQACGRVLLTDAQWNGQYELFQDGEHYVLYTDEKDLEKKVLRYLKDDHARARIERTAAAHAEQFHSTRARVGQLRELIESYLERRPRPVETVPAAPRAKRRWIFFVGDEAKTVSGRTYAETLASGLVERGDDVLVASARQRALAGDSLPRSGEGGRRQVLAEGPLPSRRGPNQLLARAAALHASFQKLADEARVEAVVGEGPLGALVAQPVAKRLEVPFVLALEECEVPKRQNRLSREQLYWAELEHWGVARAQLVVAPDRDVEQSVRRFYEGTHVAVAARAPGPIEVPRDRDRLLARIGLAGEAYTALLSAELSERDARRLLGSVQGTALALTPNEVWRKSASGALALLTARPARGRALAAILSGAQLVLAVAPADPRAAEARALGCRVHGAPAPSGRTCLDALDSIFERAQPTRLASKPELVHAIR